MVTKIVSVNRWGNGLGIRLPKEFINIRARNYKIIDTVDDDTLWEICDLAQGSIGIEPESEPSL